jgi:hypothetical protein
VCLDVPRATAGLHDGLARGLTEIGRGCGACSLRLSIIGRRYKTNKSAKMLHPSELEFKFCGMFFLVS